MHSEIKHSQTGVQDNSNTFSGWQFWIAMLHMKQWQTKKDWGNMIRSIRTLHTASPDDPQSTTVTNDDLRTMLAGVQIIPLPKI